MPSATRARATALWFVVSLCLAVSSRGQGPEPKAPLTHCAEIRRLSAEQASQGLQVSVRGVVTFSDSDSGLLFVQDDTGGIYVNPIEPVSVPFGTSVECIGVAQPGSHLPFVSSAVLLERGPARMPTPRNVTFADLARGVEDSLWVQFKAVVQSVQITGNQVRLMLGADGRRVVARVFEATEWTSDPAELVDAEVQVRGVAGALASTAPESVLLDVLVPHPRFVSTTLAGPPLTTLPIRPVAWIKEHFPTNSLTHRVRIQGRLRAEPGQPLLLQNGPDQVVLTVASLRASAPLNQWVVVSGFPAGDPTRPRLEGVVVSTLAPSVEGEPSGQNPSQPDNADALLPVLNDVAQVRRLPDEEAKRGYPVQLQGVITFSHRSDSDGYILFIQDSTAGIFVKDEDPNPEMFESGKLVELKGFSDPGDFAPVIRKTSLRVLGEAAMPVPRVVTMDELLTGRKDSQRVRVAGVITRVEAGPKTLKMLLLSAGTTIDITLPRDAAMENWERLVDAAVRVSGVCGTTFNSKRQLVGLGLFVRRGADMVVLKQAPLDPFDVGLRPIRKLYQFDLSQELGHRVRVPGTVTLRVDGEGVYVQDESDGLFVPMGESEGVVPGDRVEVLGFPQPGRPDAMLLQARLRKVRSGPEPAAVPVTQTDLATGNHDNRLIVIEATLADKRMLMNQPILVCHEGGWVFEARGVGGALNDALRGVKVGSRVRLTGVWAAHWDSRRPLNSGRLLLRSPQDLAVLERPSLWTPRVGASVGGGLLFFVLLGLAWVVLLRRQVAARTDQSQKALALFEASIEQSPSGILIADAPDVTIRWANAAAMGIRGECTEELKGIGLGLHAARWQLHRADKTPYPDRELPLSRAVLEGRVTQNEEFLIKNQQGAWRWVVANAAPIRDRQGTVSAGIMVIQDITDRKHTEEDRERLQAQLLQAQKMESVGRLAGGVAHDFNNMLQAILGNASLALCEIAGPSSLREHLEEIQKAAQRSADLTSHLLAFARKQTVSPQVLDLNDTVSGMLRMLRRLLGEDIQLVWVPGSSIWPVKIDPSQLDQVLANLTVNSRDAIVGSGRITIETSNVTLGVEHDVPECSPGDYVRLVVRDSGCGMPSEVLEHLFEPFYTTKPVGKGTGLGLATVYGIVRQNGGGIRVESAPGQGTTFRLFFPRSVAPASSAPESVTPSAYLGTETVLFVEDEPMVLSLGCRILEQHGYKVLSAALPDRALQIAGEHAGRIHLLVTDVVMPGMNGRELRDRLAQLRPGLRCLFISGYPADSITRHGILEEGVTMLPKPFTVEDLTRKVREVLGSL